MTVGKGVMIFVAIFLFGIMRALLTNGGLSPIALLLWIAGIALALAVYFIPSIVAHRKNHIQTTAITLLNIFLGWTFIGWVVALIWATMKEKSQ